MNHRYPSALDALPEALACCDPDLRLTFLNGKFERLLGLPAAEVLGRSVADLQLQNSPVAAEWLTGLRQVRQTGAPFSVALPTEAGEEHAVLEVRPELTEGQLTGVLTVVRDVTPLRHTEAELMRTRAEMAQQREELTRANGHLENFVYTVAHDLRAPVGNLSVLINLLLERPHDAESQLLMEHMHLSLRQLENTIADLVEVLEVQSTFQVMAHRLALAEAYTQVTSELSADIAAAGAIIETDFSALPQLTYIRGYLLSILRNLISNALKYRAAHRSLRIRIRAWQEGDFAVLTVQDNGIGMDLPTHGHKLFQPFSRLTAQAEGKGIGLHLLQNIVQKNGGRITVDSQPGVGTTFTCFLHEYKLP